MKKKLFIVIFIIIGLSSCEKECECFEYSLKQKASSKSVKVTICEDGATKQVTEQTLQAHLDSGATLGSCESLGIEDYDLKKPTYYSNDCNDDEIELRTVNAKESIVICN